MDAPATYILPPKENVERQKRKKSQFSKRKKNPRLPMSIPFVVMLSSPQANPLYGGMDELSVLQKHFGYTLPCVTQAKVEDLETVLKMQPKILHIGVHGNIVDS